MNPWALAVIGLGIAMIYMGVKNSQHAVSNAITGANSAAEGSGGPLVPNTRAAGFAGNWRQVAIA